MKLHPCPAQNTAFQASHCSALLLGCLKYCSRLYKRSLKFFHANLLIFLSFHLSFVITDGNNILHTPLVKHYNDLLGRQNSERGKDEVSYFYVGDVFCIQLGTKYADFQEKISAEISGKKFQTLCII